MDDIYYSRLMYEYEYKYKRFKEKAKSNYHNTTTYIIEDSLLKIKMPDIDDWVELNIKRLDNDTLILKMKLLIMNSGLLKRDMKIYLKLR